MRSSIALLKVLKISTLSLSASLILFLAVGPIAIANAMKAMRAMTSLNLASNSIGGYRSQGFYGHREITATPEGISYSIDSPYIHEQRNSSYY
jgi:hypothetical protein